jgi:hypothetical protein
MYSSSAVLSWLLWLRGTLEVGGQIVELIQEAQTVVTIVRQEDALQLMPRGSLEKLYRTPTTVILAEVKDGRLRVGKRDKMMEVSMWTPAKSTDDSVRF